MDIAQLVEIIFNVMRSMSIVVETVVKETLANPMAGLVYGGVLIIISKVKQMVFWMGVLLIFYSLLSIFGSYAGFKLPIP